MRRFSGGDRDSLRQEAVDLGEEGLRVEHHAVADEVHDARAEDAHREQVRGVFLVSEADGVAGVSSTTVAHNDLGILGEVIDDLALAFITPLEAENARIAVEKRVHVEAFLKSKSQGFWRPAAMRGRP